MRRYKSGSRPSGDSSKAGGITMKVLEKVQKLLLQIEDINIAIATARVVAKDLPLGKILSLFVSNLCLCITVYSINNNTPVICFLYAFYWLT